MNKYLEAPNKSENLSDKDLYKEYCLQWLQKNQLLTRVSLPSNFKIEDLSDGVNISERITSQIATAYVERIDEIILKSLYELYQGKANEVIVINEVEFEKFLKRYLPIYIEEKEKGLFNE